jgi:hypothetical protein
MEIDGAWRSAITQATGQMEGRFWAHPTAKFPRPLLRHNLFRQSGAALALMQLGGKIGVKLGKRMNG